MDPFRWFRTSNPPTLPTGENRKKLLKLIDIYHPGYPDLNPLLSLHASDDGGVHYTIAYYACCIVAGNIWKPDEGRTKKMDEPFLSKTRKPTPIDIPEDDILRERRYYFHNPDTQYSDFRYPIISSFDHWIFPANLPAPWESLRLSTSSASETTEDPPPAVTYHNEACRITAHLNGLDMAHMIPQVCSSWFSANYMREYASSSTVYNNALDDTSNRLPLRTDVHRFLDRSHLTIAPKPNPKSSPTATRSYTLATHVLRPPGKSDQANLEMINFYHNLKVYPLIRIPIEYTFARFAWSFFVDTVLLLFQGKVAKKTKFYISVSEESEETGARELVHKEFRKDPPLPRAGHKEKAHSSKRSRSEMEGNSEDNADDTESVNSYGSTVYDAFFEDIHSEYNGSDTYSPRKRSRFSSPSNSESSGYDLDSNYEYKSTDQLNLHVLNNLTSPTSLNNGAKLPLTETSPGCQNIGHNANGSGRMGLIKNAYGFIVPNALGFSRNYDITIG
ncbi:hypothetical protein K445DRAFT_310577 [Daldinia sp. EC12]|nr:hypothetical protein K445DRAFT_310577 [Daldinia sp. EC12]